MTTLKEFIDFMSGSNVEENKFSMSGPIQTAIKEAREASLLESKLLAGRLYVELDQNATNMRKDLLTSLKNLRCEASKIAKKLKAITKLQEDLIGLESNGDPSDLFKEMYGENEGAVKLKEFADKIGVEI